MQNINSNNSPRSFADRFLINEGGLVRLITAEEKGRPAWYVLELDKALYQKYKQALKQPVMNIKSFGNIITSGWGEPPLEIKEKYLNAGN